MIKKVISHKSNFKRKKGLLIKKFAIFLITNEVFL